MGDDQFIFCVSRVVRALSEMLGMNDLSRSRRAILEFIGELESQGEDTVVSDIVNETRFGSAPTIYAHLSGLEQDGWIESRPDPKDGRVKQVFLSDRSRKAFKRISSELRKLSSANPKTSQ